MPRSSHFLSCCCVLFVVGAGLLAGCHGASAPPTPTITPVSTGTPAPAVSAEAAGGVKFVDIVAQSGIGYKWAVTASRPLNILGTIGNGCALLDADGDGNLDILLVGQKVALYLGDGKGHFRDASTAMGFDGLHGQFLGCAVGDYDNDGYPDIYLSGYRTGILLHNEVGKRFADVTRTAGLAPQPWGTSCTWVDLDGDGKLDLYIGNYVQFGPDTKPQLCENAGQMTSCGPRFYFPEAPRLYRNLGGGKFADVTKQWGAIAVHRAEDGSLAADKPGSGQSGNAVHGKLLGVAAADFDGSGRQSLAVANDELAGDLLHNAGGKFEEIGAETGTAYDGEGNVHGGMGIDWGDYDNDGKLDLAVATFQHETKCVYHNEGKRLFTENSGMLGLKDKTAPTVAFGVKFLDFDNDGWLDLAFANGHVQDNIDAIDKSATYKETTQLLRSQNGQGFEDIGSAAGEAFQRKIVGRGLAVGDWDNDGKIDLLVVDSEGAPLLLHNETVNAGHWLLIKLQGTKSNRDGIGALVTADTGDRKLLRRCATDGSYLSASDRRVHIGLGKATSATVTVKWPSGTVSVYKNLAADRIVTLKEGESTPMQTAQK